MQSTTGHYICHLWNVDEKSFGSISLVGFLVSNKQEKLNHNAQVLSMKVAICSSLLKREAESVGYCTKENTPFAKLKDTLFVLFFAGERERESNPNTIPSSSLQCVSHFS
jgi:hypothetical protein